MTWSNGNIFRVIGPLRGDSAGDPWIPPQRPVMHSFDFLSDQTLEQTIETTVIWNAIALTMTSLQWHDVIGNGEVMSSGFVISVISITTLDSNKSNWLHPSHLRTRDRLNIKIPSYRSGNVLYKIRRYHDRLIFIMEIPIPVGLSLYWNRVLLALSLHSVGFILPQPTTTVGFITYCFHPQISRRHPHTDVSSLTALSPTPRAIYTYVKALYLSHVTHISPVPPFTKMV